MKKANDLIASHHDDVTRIKVIFDLLEERINYIRDETNQDILYINSSYNRLVDLKINNYDKLTELGFSLLKIFLPVLGFSLVKNGDFAGININLLRIST